MALTESDKVVITKYPALPSTCVICLRSSNGVLNFIDFQMSLDIYGSVNICTECLAPVSNLLGFVDKNFLEEAEEIIFDLRERIQQLEDQNAELNSTLDGIVGLRPDVNVSSVPADEESTKDSGKAGLDLELEFDI